MNVWPTGCEQGGCIAHYPRSRNMAAEGCLCPAWFDGGGWHIIERNSRCEAHRAECRRCGSTEHAACYPAPVEYS